MREPEIVRALRRRRAELLAENAPEPYTVIISPSQEKEIVAYLATREFAKVPTCGVSRAHGINIRVMR